MPTIVVETAQGQKRVRVDDGLTDEQLAEVAEEVAAQFSQPAAPTQATAPGMGGIGGAGEMTGLVDPEAARSTMLGVAEGGRLLLDRAKQIGGAVQDMFGLLFEGKAYRRDDRATGGTQGYTEGSAFNKATATALLRQQVQLEEDKQKQINPGIRSGVAQATQLAGAVVAPEAALPRATTMISAALKNTVSGTAGSMLMFDEDQDIGKDALIAGGASAAVGVLPSVGPAMWNQIGRWITRAAREGGTQKELAAVRDIMPDFQPTLAQATGIPELGILERRAYNSELLNFYAKQSDKFVKDFETVFRVPTPTGVTLSSSLSAAQLRADAALKGIKSNAMKAWDDGMEEAARIERDIIANPSVQQPRGPMTFQQGGVPGRPQGTQPLRPRQRADIQVTNFAAMHQKWLAEASDEAVRGTTGTTKARLRGLSKILYDDRGPRTLSAEDLSRVLKSVTAIGRDDPAAAKQLRDALERDFDALAASGSGAQNEVVQQILDTRAMYKAEMAKAEALAKSTAFKLMGVPDKIDDVNASDLVDRFVVLDPSRQREARQFMQQHSPDLLATLRGQIIKDAVASTRTIRPAADSVQDPMRLIDNLFDAKRGYDLRTSGLWGADDLAKMEKVKSGLRVILNMRPDAVGVGTPILAEDVAINLMSRHAGFLARQVTRVLMGSDGWRFFTDPELMKRLTAATRSTTGTPSNLVARAAVLEYLNSYGAEQETEQ